MWRTSNKQVRSSGAVKILGKAGGQLLIRKLLWTEDCSRCWTLWPRIRQSLSSVCVSVMERHAGHGCYSPFHCCDKIPTKIIFQGEDCINWADGSNAFSPWLAKGNARSSRHSRASWQVTHGGQLLASWQRKVKRYRVRVRTRCLSQDLAFFTWVLPTTWCWLLKL